VALSNDPSSPLSTTSVRKTFQELYFKHMIPVCSYPDLLPVDDPTSVPTVAHQQVFLWSGQITGLTNSQISGKIRAQTISAPTGGYISQPKYLPNRYRGTGQWIGLKTVRPGVKYVSRLVPTGGPSNVPTTSCPRYPSKWSS
jgi:hypothetical protein